MFVYILGGDVFVEFGDMLIGDSSFGIFGGDVSVVLGRVVVFYFEVCISGGKVSDSGFEILNMECWKNRILGVVNGGGDWLWFYLSGGDIMVCVC